MKNLILFILFCAASCLVIAAPSLAQTSSEMVRREIEANPAQKLAKLGYDVRLMDLALDAVYNDHDYQPLWYEGRGLSHRAQALLKAFRQAEKDGLTRSDYLTSSLELVQTPLNVQEAAKMDVALSLSVLRLLIDARWGRPLAHSADGEEPIVWDRRSKDIASVLHDVANSDDPFSVIQARFPTHDQYRHLKTAIERYFEILTKGEYPQISGGTELKLGSVDARVRALKQILINLGDLDPDSLTEDIFDSNLVEAVQRFQSRHGLKASGIVNRATLVELNVSPHERLKTLILNLERWRWIPDEREAEKLIFVNVAGFELAALARHELVLRSRVVVGKLYQATPLISSYIEKVEFNPYWNVPDSITRNEILPKLKKDPNYLTKEHMRILARDDPGSELSLAHLGQRNPSSIQIRQDPGPGNALGRVKIVFPNRHSVYLHDTPSRQFFARETRAFSHGCIRVADAFALAAFLLDEPDDRWTVERATEVAATNKTVVLKLRNPVKIAVSYRTAWVDLDGQINFRGDIYGRDARMKRVLFTTRASIH